MFQAAFCMLREQTHCHRHPRLIYRFGMDMYVHCACLNAYTYVSKCVYAVIVCSINIYIVATIIYEYVYEYKYIAIDNIY